MDYEPVAVALKFGFLVVLYLFLLWIARSALKDLRRTASPVVTETGFHPEAGAAPEQRDAWLVVERGGGMEPGERFDLFGGLSIGRSAEADVTLDDRFASGIHARIYSRGGVHYVEDMNSTNGTLLNAEPLVGEAELSAHDEIQIGDTLFRYEPER
jgi:FHA domain